MMLSDGRYLFEFPPREDFARRVSRSVDYDATGFRGNDIAEPVDHQWVVGRIKRYQNRLAMLADQGGIVIAVVRFEENDFITGIQQCAACRIEAACCAGGDEYLGSRTGRNSVLNLQFAGDGMT